jgi:hypothetical protein
MVDIILLCDKPTTHGISDSKAYKFIKKINNSHRFLAISQNISILLTSVDTEMCCPKGKCGCQLN